MSFHPITRVEYDKSIGCNWSFYPGEWAFFTNNSSYTLPKEILENSIKTNHPETSDSPDGPVEPDGMQSPDRQRFRVRF
jgi:hypothetical protein